MMVTIFRMFTRNVIITEKRTVTFTELCWRLPICVTHIFEQIPWGVNLYAVPWDHQQLIYWLNLYLSSPWLIPYTKGYFGYCLYRLSMQAAFRKHSLRRNQISDYNREMSRSGLYKRQHNLRSHRRYVGLFYFFQHFLYTKANMAIFMLCPLGNGAALGNNVVHDVNILACFRFRNMKNTTWNYWTAPWQQFDWALNYS